MENLNAQLSFTGLGIRSRGTIDVSDDGSVVAGGFLSGFRWTAAAGAMVLPDLPGYDFPFGAGVSGNGEVIVGWTGAESGIIAFRHTQASGSVPLTAVDGATISFASGVSGDGSIIVGSSQPIAAAGEQATRWLGSNEPELLPFQSGGNRSDARAISADGSTIVGYSHDAAGVQRAVRWTGNEAAKELGTGTDREVIFSTARGVSADGKFIVGENFIDPEHRSEAFIWSEETGTVGLGLLEGSAYSQANGVTADGSIVIGEGGSEGFVWTAETGMLNLIETLRDAFGLEDELRDWGGLQPTAISPDGRYMVGWGTHNNDSEPWLIDRGANPPSWGSGFTPVPEPSSYGLTGTALIVGLVLRRRFGGVRAAGLLLGLGLARAVFAASPNRIHRL
jgi:probable HAF family extracellular repeat protein